MVANRVNEMSDCCRGEPVARSAQAGVGDKYNDSTDLTSQIIRTDAAVRLELNAIVTSDVFRASPTFGLPFRCLVLFWFSRGCFSFVLILALGF